jgi:hypothetical protein
MARTPADVPDCPFPSGNRWGIPDLDPAMQADVVDLPFRGWGTVARRSRMRGTWHWYVDDYRFATLWTTPSQVVNTAAVTVCEPNYSCNDQTPAAVALWNIYRKRWLARWWQSQGLRVLVDLFVDKRWDVLNLSGVPECWRAFATRASDEHLDDLIRQHRIAREMAGMERLLFVVYSGGPAVRTYCRENGLLYFADQGNVARMTRAA